MAGVSHLLRDLIRDLCAELPAFGHCPECATTKDDCARCGGTGMDAEALDRADLPARTAQALQMLDDLRASTRGPDGTRVPPDRALFDELFA